METCKTCKFWNVRLKVKDGVSDCDKVDDINRDKSRTFEIEVRVHDDSGLDAVLMTGENFGCIHHIKK